MLGLGGARDPVGRQGAGGASSELLRPSPSTTRPGCRRSCPSAGGSASTRSPARCPSRSDAEYRLTVDGAVDRPATLDLADLRERLPQTALTRDFQCVTGWRVADVPWRGVKLADLLDRAGVQPGATHVRFWSFDGVYTETLTLEQAQRDDVLVAHQMLGKPVTREHGGPVRLYVAPMYGYKSLKWLERIEVVTALDEPTDPGYWESLGYDVDAWVGRSNGRDDDADVTATDAPTPVVDGGDVVRFDRAERWLHWSNATLFLVLLATGMTLYVPAAVRAWSAAGAGEGHPRVSAACSCRCRCSLAYAGRWRDGRARATCAAWPAGRSTTAAGSLSLGRRGRPRMGKFNAGQKLNAIFVAGCIPVMLATGAIMRWFDPFPLAWRTGATFVHDWLALALLVVIVGHIGKALAEPVVAAGDGTGHGARRATPSATTRAGGPSCRPATAGGRGPDPRPLDDRRPYRRRPRGRPHRRDLDPQGARGRARRRRRRRRAPRRRSRPRSPAGARSGSPTARAARSACRPTSSPTSRSAARTTSAASASEAEPDRRGAGR